MVSKWGLGVSLYLRHWLLLDQQVGANVIGQIKSLHLFHQGHFIHVSIVAALEWPMREAGELNALR